MAESTKSHLQKKCGYCEKPLSDIEIDTNKTKKMYCDKICMGKAQTKKATMTLTCSYCKNEYETLKGRFNDRHQFCSQSCSLKVRMDRYFWSICNALAEIDDWASADMIRMRLKDHRVDLTSMRIATRISHNKLIEVMEDSEPYQYRLKEMFKEKPWTWHTSKFFRKVSMERHDYVVMFETENGDDVSATNSD